MKSLLEIRQQIDKTKDLSNIISTMKNISIVNMTHYERKLHAVRQYFSNIERGFQIFLKNDSNDILEILKEKNRETPRSIAAIVIGSEKGLCGEFNEKIHNYYIEKSQEQEIFAAVGIGYKISSQLRHERLETFDFPTTHEAIMIIIGELLSMVENWLFEKRVGEVVFFHHQLLSPLKYKPISTIVFPLNLDWLENLQKQPWPSSCLPIHTMDKETLFYELTQEYLFISMYRAFIESLASENAGRLFSMQTGEEKIQEQLSELKQNYNQQRQIQVTEELSDIIASFEELKKANRNF